jgi:hypothetical protein
MKKNKAKRERNWQHRVHKMKKNKAKRERNVSPVVSFSLFLLCFSSSCVPYVASFFGLSICDCPCGVI